MTCWICWSWRPSFLPRVWGVSSPNIVWRALGSMRVSGHRWPFQGKLLVDNLVEWAIIQPAISCRSCEILRFWFLFTVSFGIFCGCPRCFLIIEKEDLDDLAAPLRQFGKTSQWEAGRFWAVDVCHQHSAALDVVTCFFTHPPNGFVWKYGTPPNLIVSYCF